MMPSLPSLKAAKNAIVPKSLRAGAPNETTMLPSIESPTATITASQEEIAWLSIG
jgi:hypothetical protein